jgi:hypothetical protein
MMWSIHSQAATACTESLCVCAHIIIQSRRELAHVMEKRKSEAEAHMKITDTALAALRLVASYSKHSTRC